jgi:hypothetical protein
MIAKGLIGEVRRAMTMGERAFLTRSISLIVSTKSQADDGYCFNAEGTSLIHCTYIQVI